MAKQAEERKHTAITMLRIFICICYTSSIELNTEHWKHF